MSRFNVFQQLELNQQIPTTEDIKKKILNNKDDFIFHLKQTIGYANDSSQERKSRGVERRHHCVQGKERKVYCIILHLSSENFFHVAPGRPAAQILTESEYFHVEIDDLYIFKQLAASWDCFINVNMNTCSICLVQSRLRCFSKVCVYMFTLEKAVDYYQGDQLILLKGFYPPLFLNQL